jgi:hypothetical protein
MRGEAACAGFFDRDKSVPRKEVLFFLDFRGLFVRAGRRGTPALNVVRSLRVVATVFL